MATAAPPPRQTGPLLFLVVFGGVFALLGGLTLAIVLSAVLERDQRILSAFPTLMVMAGFLAAAAWVFGTALRMPFRRHPLGEVSARVEPAAPISGHDVLVRVDVEPPAPVEVEEAFALLLGAAATRDPGWLGSSRRSILLQERITLEPADVDAGDAGTGAIPALVRLAPDAPGRFEGRVRVPPGSEPSGENGDTSVGWSVRVVLVSRQGPDWIRDIPLTVLPP